MEFTFETAEKIVREESVGKELLIYLAVGCALGRYTPGEHPKQQNPPYLLAFKCQKICILIDPFLESPPRALEDKGLHENTIFLPIQQNFEYSSEFLKNLIELCMDPTKRVKMVLHDFTGTDSNTKYPLHLHFEYGQRLHLFKNVLFDPTYGDGGCSPNLDVNILQDSSGFIQPKYCRLRDLQKVDRAVFMSEFAARKYPLVHLIARMYRIHQGFEEVRDWCTDEIIQAHYMRFCIIYNVQDTEYLNGLRRILLETVEDLCAISETFLTADEIRTVAEGGIENMWKMVGIFLGPANI